MPLVVFATLFCIHSWAGFLLPLPKSRPELTVVLDLDETLAWYRGEKPVFRSYAFELLNALQKLDALEIVLWTAGDKNHVESTFQGRGDIQTLFHHVITRDTTGWFNEQHTVKDLRMLGRNLDRVVIVENSPQNVKLQQKNALLVHDFVGLDDEDDHSLKHVFEVIKYLYDANQQKTDDLLYRVANEKRLCSTIFYPLHTQWTQELLRTTNPHAIPPHGVFFRAFMEPQS